MIALFNEENIQKAYGKEKFDEGRAEEAGLMAKLAMLLARDGKIEDIARAGTDAEYRNMLYREYQLA